MLSSLVWITLIGQTVPVFPPEAGTAPVYKFIDSLELHKLEIDIQKAEEQVTQANILHRLIPNISISASYGIGSIVFIDPTSVTTFSYPKDNYRISLNLSISELFLSSKHSEAILNLSKLQSEYQHMKYLQQANQIALRLELNNINYMLQSLDKQLSMIQDIIHFNELRFEQGKIEYDALIRTKLELLSLQSNINTLKHQQSKLLLKVNNSCPEFMKTNEFSDNDMR